MVTQKHPAAPTPGRIWQRTRRLTPFLLAGLLLIATGLARLEPPAHRRPAHSNPPVNIPEAARARQAMEQVLIRFVDDSGRVNYASLRDDPNLLQPFVEFIGAISPRSDPTHFASREHEWAYWINAYNALAIWEVLEKGISASVRGRDFGIRFFALTRHLVGGERLSLYTIENSILRKGFVEPRIHFAINCASGSCPPLSRRLMDGENLNEQLEAAAHRFINDPSNVSMDAQNRTVLLNRIFKWYADDFGGSTEQVLQYVARYHPDLRTLLDEHEDAKWQIVYKPFNWQLNEQPPKPS